MTYADIGRVRKLAGNPNVNDVSDADIIAAIAYSDNRVEAETAHSGWVAGDEDYAMLVQASEFFASSIIRDRFKVANTDMGGIAHFQAAIEICEMINKSAPAAIILAHSEFATFPANPDGKMWRSLPGTGSALGDGSLIISGQSDEDLNP